MDKIVMVTGATSGIGKAIAEKFASSGYSVIITGRRIHLLDQLRKKLEADYGARVHTLELDVQDREKVFASIENLPEAWTSIDILVNNAGLALGRDYFEEAEMSDWETMIDTNLKGLLYVSRAVIPLMVAQGKGHIINVGSIAGKEVYEKGNVYCASKAAVDSVSRGMRIDLLRHKIRVTAIHPGAVETEFSVVRFKGDEDQARKVYEGYQPMIGEDVANVAFYCATVPEHYCINDIVVTPTAQGSALYIQK